MTKQRPQRNEQKRTHQAMKLGEFGADPVDYNKQVILEEEKRQYKSGCQTFCLTPTFIAERCKSG